MSVNNEAGAAGGASSMEPEQYRSAEEYARERLADAEGTLTPSVLANDYGCVPGHMRRTLRILVEDGDAVRVNRGEYVGPEALARVSDVDGSGDQEGAREEVEGHGAGSGSSPGVCAGDASGSPVTSIEELAERVAELEGIISGAGPASDHASGGA